MRVDLEPGAMVKQAVEDVGRFVRRGRDDGDVVRAVLIGDVSVKRKPRIDAVFGVEVAGAAASLPRAEELAVGRRAGPLAPYRRDRERMMRVDNPCQCGPVRPCALLGHKYTVSLSGSLASLFEGHEAFGVESHSV